MRCPIDQNTLTVVHYEGCMIHACDACGGELVGSETLGQVVNARRKRFTPELEELADSIEPVHGVPLDESRRDLPCPFCGSVMETVNYGGDTTVYVDRCPSCHAVWLDEHELELIKILMERWTKAAPEKLRSVACQLEAARAEAAGRTSRAFQKSRFSFVNALINRALDAA
jgi:Zn-finger nucleic acid-binding protein